MQIETWKVVFEWMVFGFVVFLDEYFATIDQRWLKASWTRGDQRGQWKLQHKA